MADGNPSLRDVPKAANVDDPGKASKGAPSGRGPDRGSRTDHGELARKILPIIGLPSILVLSFLLFSLLKPEIFPTWGNVKAILLTQSVLMILALGALLPLVVGEFDLSIGGNLSLSLILVTGLCSKQGMGLAPAIVIALAGSTFVGLINGVLVNWVRINAFIATLAMGLILQGAVVWYTNSQVIFENIPKALPNFGKSTLLGLPLPVVVVIVVMIVVGYVLTQTPLGRRFYAVGGSRDAARLAGIDVRRTSALAFIMGGFICGIAGVTEAAVIGTGNPTVGQPFLLPAFAACFLGATMNRFARFNVIGTILAVLTIAVGVAGLELNGVPYYIEPIFNGVVLLIAVTLSLRLRADRQA